MITSAGVVLAATFTVLGVLPLVFLADIGFAGAFGVLLDTFIVRAALVPALVYDIGPTIRWPPKLSTTGQQLPKTRAATAHLTSSRRHDRDNTMHPHPERPATADPANLTRRVPGQPPQPSVATNGHRS